MKLYHGDCLEELKKIPDNSVDSIVTDPPYGLSNTKPQQVADVLKAWVTGDTVSVPAKKGGFMGKDWDSFVPPPAVWEECMRVLKPGGHMAVFAGTRTQDLMGLSIRLAGFEIRDTLGWVYGSGFPKSMNISKAIDRAAGKLAPESTGFTVAGYSHNPDKIQHTAPSQGYVPPEPVTDGAKQWDGWGTALKPAIEPIVLARKPLEGTAANNVLTYGTGGLNIDASRVGTTGGGNSCKGGDDCHCFDKNEIFGATKHPVQSDEPKGRFPANILLDEDAAEAMDEQSGSVNGVIGMKKVSGGHNFNIGEHTPQKFTKTSEQIKDSGGASRFFTVFKYQKKAPKKERPVIEREDGTKIQHPTVKPVALMEWLVTLVTPANGVVLDPFAGSGTTLQAAINEGFDPIGVEQDVDYIQLINKRLDTTIER